MFARLVTYHGHPDKLQDAVREWEKWRPTPESLKGLQNVYVLTDKKTGNFSIVSFWDTEEHLNASFNAIIPVRDAISKALGMTGVPTPETYEVSREGIQGMRKAA